MVFHGKNMMSMTSDSVNNPFICLSDGSADDNVTAPEDISAFISVKPSSCFLPHLLLCLAPTSVSVFLSLVCFTPFRILPWLISRRTAHFSPYSKIPSTVLTLEGFCRSSPPGEQRLTVTGLTQCCGEWS